VLIVFAVLLLMVTAWAQARVAERQRTGNG
jgi:hypothetical protein